MNTKKIRRIFLVNFILIIAILLYGCKKDSEIEENKINILNGAIAIEDSGQYKIYNLINNKYEKVDTEYIITSYDLKSGSFIYSENGEYKIKHSGKEELIEDNKTVISPKLSENGKYVAYFTKEVYLNLKLKDLVNNEEVSINSNVAISGSLMDWLDEKNLVYYGVDNNKNNGLFIYNIEEKQEKLLYKIDLGYVEFLKGLDNGVVFLQEKEGKQKIFKIIDSSGKAIDIIENVMDVSDVEVTSKGIFILGKLQDNNYSLYKINDGKAKRLVYDFPKLINLDKGLSKDENGNIIFIGGDIPNQEKIYVCEDDAISTIHESSGSYNFIDCN
jgi:hypothetical protein